VALAVVVVVFSYIVSRLESNGESASLLEAHRNIFINSQSVAKTVNNCSMFKYMTVLTFSIILSPFIYILFSDKNNQK
jgi:hypothetical protein